MLNDLHLLDLESRSTQLFIKLLDQSVNQSLMIHPDTHSDDGFLRLELHRTSTPNTQNSLLQLAYSDNGGAT